MKKLLKFAVIAMFLATNVAYGQQPISAQATKAQATRKPVAVETTDPDPAKLGRALDNMCITGMVMLVEAATPYYVKGTDLKAFIASFGTEDPDMIAFITRLHRYLESGTSAKDIQATYDGKEIRVLMLKWPPFDIKNPGSPGPYNPNPDTPIAISTGCGNVPCKIARTLVLIADIICVWYDC
jgi:hypothetical protein